MSISSSELARAMSIAENWAAGDPDPQTKAEALAMINLITMGEDSGAKAVIDQFGSTLSFGTAGLRGELGAGPNRMNRLVVMHASAAFAKWLLARSSADSGAPHIVVGFDARNGSTPFARAAAEVFAGAGLRVTLLPGPLPTPVTAFSVRHLNAQAGVMITASHNPPRDNGYKVYLGDKDSGSQIAPPVDLEIASLIEQVAAAPVSDIALSTDYELAGDEIITAYCEALASEWIAPPPSDDFKIVYTAMHGVGSAVTNRVFERLKLPALHAVAEQDTPDPAFPTVSFPNPEEPGALDLAFAKGRELNADLIVAQDPDADRLAVAVKSPESETGFKALTGNQLGLLLGIQAAERFASDSQGAGALACTIVSSPALKPVAKHFGLGYEETLSGFKWVSRVPNLVFGFEEALGYLTRPNIVRDKDGISASADLVSLALSLHAKGQTLLDMLAEAAEKFGAYESAQITLRLESMAAASALSAEIRRDPPKKFGTVAVTKISDLLEPGAAEVPADVLRFDLADGSRVMIRPSGTEPKLKLYLDVSSETGSANERLAAATSRIKELEEEVKEALHI